MIFIGDIAHPFPTPPVWIDIKWPWSSSQMVVANLEGPIVFDSKSLEIYMPGLFNDVSILDALKSLNVRVVSLANNHIMDVPGSLSHTLSALQTKNIKYTGAGTNLHDASTHTVIKEQNQEWVFLSVGWETIRCQAATANRPGVYPFRYKNIFQSVSRLRKQYTGAKIILLVHWNYELELYPQPAHRQFAMDLIDEGADGVMGHHPHRVGGVEIYNGHPIAYSLGNWWIPQGVYYSGRLKFGDETLLQLALEWTSEKKSFCHWFEYNRNGHKLTNVCNEPLSQSEQLKKLTPFAGMDHKEYKQWFSTHRVKRKALPIYNDYRQFVLNSLKDRYVHSRHSAIRLIEAVGLRNMLKAS